MATQKTTHSQSNLEKEKWSWRNQRPRLQTYYKATVIKTIWYWHKNKTRSMEQYRNLKDAHVVTLSLIKEARIYNGEKTAS